MATVLNQVSWKDSCVNHFSTQRLLSDAWLEVQRFTWCIKVPSIEEVDLMINWDFSNCTDLNLLDWDHPSGHSSFKLLDNATKQQVIVWSESYKSLEHKNTNLISHKKIFKMKTPHNSSHLEILNGSNLQGWGQTPSFWSSTWPLKSCLGWRGTCYYPWMAPFGRSR